MKKMKSTFIVSIMILATVFSVTFSVNAQPNKSEILNAKGTEYWALVIGTDPEAYCDNDADDMYNVLINNGWDSSHVSKLTRKSATKENFIDEINWLDSNEDRDDVVLFFFSGHGGTRCIAFYDEWSGTYNMDAVYLLTLSFHFNKLESNKFILIFDTCHAASLGAKTNPLMRSSLYQANSEHTNSIQAIKEEDEEPVGILGLGGFGRIVIASCGRFEYAYGSPDYENGFFTYHYVEGLKGGADSNSNGRVSAEEAFNYAKPRTIEDTKNDPKTETQHPKMSDKIIGQVDITNMAVINRNSESYLNKLIIDFREKVAILLENIRALLNK